MPKRKDIKKILIIGSGPIVIGQGCEFECTCEINTKLSCLQLYIDGYLNGISLAEIAGCKKNAKEVLKHE